MSAHDVIVGMVVEEGLTLEELARACAVDTGWVVHRVSEGYFPAMPGATTQWRFTTVTLQRARRMRAIERDFEAAPELAALVADMLDEIDVLRARLHRGGFE